MLQNYLKPNDNTQFYTEWNPNSLHLVALGLGAHFFLSVLLKQVSQAQPLLRGCHVPWRTFSSILDSTHYTPASALHTYPSVVTIKNVSSHSLPNVPWRAIFPLVDNYCFQTPNFLEPGHSHMSFFCKQNSSLDSTHSWLLLLLQISTKHLLFWDTFLAHSI